MGEGVMVVQYAAVPSRVCIGLGRQALDCRQNGVHHQGQKEVLLVAHYPVRVAANRLL